MEETVPDRAPTLFPKITWKIGEIDRQIRHLKKLDATDLRCKSTKFPMIGTVKLHGCHADIVIRADNTITLQSRNQPDLNLERDVREYARFMLPLNNECLTLKTRYHERFRILNPNEQINEEYPVIIAGEWIGPKVQDNVAISKLPQKCFVIISVSINNEWLPDEPYADINSEEVGIYNVTRAGFFHETLDITMLQETRDRLQLLTDAVEQECPFAKTFGLSGIGEGIVWKIGYPLSKDATFWLKTKGPLHRISNTEDLPPKRPGVSDLAAAKTFAEACVTEMRLEQGWAYLEEMGLKTDRTGTGEFMKWIMNDVEIEEKSEMENLGLGVRMVRNQAGSMAKVWYTKRMFEG